MNTDKETYGDADVTRSVIGAAYTVANRLGPGFLEKVYENALAFQLRREGHKVEQQKQMEVFYEDEMVGLYQADLVIDGNLIVELKAVCALERIHRAQCLNYLRATHVRTGLVINFGRPRVEIQRVVSY